MWPSYHCEEIGRLPKLYAHKLTTASVFFLVYILSTEFRHTLVRTSDLPGASGTANSVYALFSYLLIANVKVIGITAFDYDLSELFG